MRRNQLLTLVGCLTFAIAGCASEETPPPAATSPTPSPVTAASPGLIGAPKAGVATTQPLVAQRPPLPPPVAGLIPSTNPEERERQVQTRERTGKTTDPFSALPPDINRTKTAAAKPIPKVAQLPAKPPGETAAKPGPGNAGTGAGTASSTPTKKELESPTIPKIQSAPLGVKLPPAVNTAAAPSTTTASSVEVTGVIVVGNVPQAIVVAPGDVSSRYVKPGERISGGKVLVKRIELGNGSEPIVILEENGVEVTKAVGEKPPQPDKKTTA